MVLVILGTQQNDFHRLLENVEKCIENGKIKEKVIVQAGSTKFESDKMEIFDMISREKLEKLICDASFIITHGGVGSIIISLKHQKKIIAVPRLSKYSEHVNNHQLQIINVFNQKGYLIGTSGVEGLEKALENVEDFKPNKYNSNAEKIINIIDDFIKKV